MTRARAGYQVSVDWSGWAVFGLLATAALTSFMVVAQMTGHTRMDIPLLLGTIFVADPDRARVVGALVHVVDGQIFALGYALVFSVLDRNGALVGGVLGLLHGVVAVSLIVPLLPGVHPRMATSRSGPFDGAATLEPPGPFSLNYGRETAVLTLAAHVVYGVVLGLLVRPS